MGTSSEASGAPSDWKGGDGAIDIWCNMFTPEVCRRVYVDTPEMKTVSDWWPGSGSWNGMSVPDFLGNLDSAGFGRIIVPAIQMWSYKTRSLMYAVEVDEVAAIAAEAPDRIFGACGLNPFDRMGAVRALERAVLDKGFVAGHVHPYGYGLPLNDRDWYPMYAKCAELGVPVIMQTGHSAELMPNAVGRPILVDDIALYFPELTIVCSHTGWPWVEELISLAWKHPNVYIGTTSHAPKYWDEKLVRFANSRGKEKVLFGSGYPTFTHERARSDIDALTLSEDAAKKVLRDNASAVFGFDGA